MVHFADKTTNRAQFIKLFSYIQSNLDFEKLEQDKMLEVYFQGMDFFNEICGNSSYSHLFDEDIQLLLSLRNKTLTNMELCEKLSLPLTALSPKLYKLAGKGLVCGILEKKKRYYTLTPYGNKILEQELLERS